MSHHRRPFDQQPQDAPPSAEKFAVAVGQLWWTTRPTLRLEVDSAADRLLVTGRAGPPEVEVDFGAQLSVAFCGSVLTSLGLAGVSRWSQRPAEVVLACRLLGPRASEAVRELLPAGGAARITLESAEAEHLIAVWSSSIEDHGGADEGAALGGDAAEGRQ